MNLPIEPVKPKTPGEKLAERFELTGLTYGDHINHSDIDEWAEFNICDSYEGKSNAEIIDLVKKQALERLVAVDRFREWLLTEKLMLLVSVQGAGYRIAKPEEQTDLAVSKGLKVVRRGLEQAERGVKHINSALLSDQERERNVTVQTRLGGLRMMIGKKKDYLPKLPSKPASES